MLNPKLVEIYGKEAGDMLEKLAQEIGEDLAKTCYIMQDNCRHRVGGVLVPNGMYTTSGRSDEVSDGVLSFTNKYSHDGEDFWIVVLDSGLGGDDIKLWV